jgi:hypothetical protein
MRGGVMSTNHTGGNLRLVPVDPHEPTESEMRQLCEAARAVKAGLSSGVLIEPRHGSKRDLFIRNFKWEKPPSAA